MKEIVTLTLNPTVDLIAEIGRVEPDRKLRVHSPRYEPGGGGINVSRAIHKLGGESSAVYTAGGPTGDMLEQLLDEEGVDHHPVAIDAWTRQNPNIFETESDHAYRFILPGPELDKRVLQRCAETLFQEADAVEYLVLSGSLPRGLPADSYNDIIDQAVDRGIKVIFDASGESLRQGLDRGVYLVKPNLRELHDLLGREVESDEQIAAAARELIENDRTEVVLVSVGGGGALLVTADEQDRIPSPTVPIRSRIGAGDSLVGALSLALSRGWPIRQAARFGVAAGAAAVKTPGTQLCRRDDTEALYKELQHQAEEEARRG
ncbi:MAG: 1-phosphofructokinase family hexose kinase [Phycisphaeraceae bacterium]